ncbi:hypothetical protein VTI74DRAFT_1294 [Chaetomium olivicolor]
MGFAVSSTVFWPVVRLVVELRGTIAPIFHFFQHFHKQHRSLIFPPFEPIPATGRTSTPCLRSAAGRDRRRHAKNPSGSNCKAVTASFTSSPYRNAAYLADKLGKTIYAMDGRSCAAGLQTISSIANLPRGMKAVAKHVMEIQPTRGTVVQESFYNAVGTLSDACNNLVLDSLTNGLKATIWAGAKNIVDPDKRTKMGHAGRLGTLQRIKAVFDYLNNVDGLNSLSSAYGNLYSLTPFLTQALLTQNAITYDTKTAFTQYDRAHFDYMVANTITWITPKLAEEATYWASATAATYYGATTAQNNLALVRNLGKMTWAAIIMTWLV